MPAKKNQKTPATKKPVVAKKVTAVKKAAPAKQVAAKKSPAKKVAKKTAPKAAPRPLQERRPRPLQESDVFSKHIEDLVAFGEEMIWQDDETISFVCSESHEMMDAESLELPNDPSYEYSYQSDTRSTIELINEFYEASYAPTAPEVEHFMLGSMSTSRLHSSTASAETSDFIDLENLIMPTAPHQGPTPDEQDLVL